MGVCCRSLERALRARVGSSRGKAQRVMLKRRYQAEKWRIISCARKCRPALRSCWLLLPFARRNRFRPMPSSYPIPVPADLCRVSFLYQKGRGVFLPSSGTMAAKGVPVPSQNWPSSTPLMVLCFSYHIAAGRADRRALTLWKGFREAVEILPPPWNHRRWQMKTSWLR